MTSGEWFGSMIPPAPTLMVDVPPATCAITTDVAALATAGHVVVLGEPVAVVAPPLGMLREVEAVPERLGGAATLDNRSEIKDGKRRHVLYLRRACRTSGPRPWSSSHSAPSCRPKWQNSATRDLTQVGSR